MRTVQRQELDPWQRELLAAAEVASETANCPYSGYPVGAALRVRTRSGKLVTVTGSNSETANYRSVCAEKHAVHRALAEHSWHLDGVVVRPEVLAAAVYCAVGARPQQPCGDCRQTLHEVNPAIEVIAAAGPGADGAHDPRVTLTNLRALLPHGFEVASLRGEIGGDGAGIEDPAEVADYVVHLPKPVDLETDAADRAALLAGVRYLILVGSPRRARRVAELARERFGAVRDADGCCYCDLTVPGRDESGREYAVYVPELPAGPRIAVASHGIGPAGVEIVLSELPALLALAQGGRAPDLEGAIRCGTRGALCRVPVGSVALSTSTFDPDLARLRPSAEWLEKIRGAARSRGMTVVGEDEIDGRSEDRWGEATSVLAEGPGISTPFFWHGQGRPLYRGHRRPMPPEILALERRERRELLAAWVEAGVRWIEMEDATVLKVAEQCGIPAVTLGAVVAHRRRADGSFQFDYSKTALGLSELLPAEIALAAIAADAAGPAS